MRNQILAIASAIAASISALPAYSAPPLVNDIDASRIRGCGLFVHRYGQSERYVIATVIYRETEGIDMWINGQRQRLMQLDTSTARTRNNQRRTHRFRTEDRNTFVKLEGIWEPGVEGVVLKRGTLSVSQNQETTTLEVTGYWGC